MNTTFRRVTSAAILSAALFLGTTALVRAETAGNHLDDATVTTMIKAKLLADQSLKSFEIHVDTSPTIVHISGTVPTKLNRADAYRITEGEAGDRAIKNDIVVQ